MKGYTEPEKLKCWWPTMLVMHTRARYKTLQMGPHWTTTYFLEVAKPAGMCSTLRIHSQCECCTLSGVCRMPKFFFFQMAHDKVFGIRCKKRKRQRSDLQTSSLRATHHALSSSPVLHMVARHCICIIGDYCKTTNMNEI